MAIKSSDAFNRFQKVVQTPGVDQKTIDAEFSSLLSQTIPAEREQFRSQAERLVTSTKAGGANLQQPAPAAGVARGQTTAATPEQQPPPAIQEKPVEVTQQSYSASQFRQLAEQQLQIIQQVQRDLAANRAQQQKEAAQVAQDRDAALADLTKAVLPDINPNTLLAASRVVGLKPDQIADLKGDEEKLKAQFADATKKVDESLDALAKLLNVPADGASAVAKKDSDELHAKLADLQKKLGDYQGAQGLIDRGYDTPKDKRWYTSPSYWQDRNLAKTLMTKFGKHTWAEVVKDYQALLAQQAAMQQQSTSLDNALNTYTAARGVAVGLRAQLQNLPADVLNRARDTVARIFRTTAKEDLAKRLTDADLLQLFKTYSALSAKVDYMADISKQLIQQEQKYADEAARLQKDAIGWANNKLRKGGATLTQKQAMWRLGCYDWDARARAYNRIWIINRRIYEYNTYYRSPSLLETWLWWYVFTGGFYDNWYRPSDVIIWGDSHPDYHYNPPPGADTDAARRQAEEAHRNRRPGGDQGNRRPGGDRPEPPHDGNTVPGGDGRVNS